MNPLDRAIGFFAPATALRRLGARQQLARATKRLYDAGAPTRTTAGWRRPFSSARSETYQALPYLRAGAHDIVRNNPHGAKALGSLADDLIGTGIMPRANTGRKALNKKVDAVAAEFFAAIDADGITKNYPAFQRLAARAFFEGGEAVLRRYVRPTRLGLAVPLQFALLEGEFIDNQRNFILPSGNRVVQGVEIDPETRIREAYHMFREHPGDVYMAALDGSIDVIRVPATDISIIMEPQRPGQIRGVPWLTPILVRAKLLDDYEDAERQRKRIESSMSMVVKSNRQLAEASENQGPSVNPTVVDSNGDLIERVEAGGITYARDTDSIEFMKPADAMAFGPYKRAELQSIAAGARSTYELMSGDLSQTSFSSIQFGTLSYRNMMDVIRQAVVIPHLEWIWRCMIDVAIAVGKLPAETPYGVKHHCPPWQPIDPVKQAEADKIMIRTGVKTLEEVVTARGKVFEEHIAEIGAGNKLLDRYGLVLDSDPRRTDGRGVDQNIADKTADHAPPPSPAPDPDDQGASPTADDGKAGA